VLGTHWVPSHFHWPSGEIGGWAVGSVTPRMVAEPAPLRS
jgi:hypothetical protein